MLLRWRSLQACLAITIGVNLLFFLPRKSAPSQHAVNVVSHPQDNSSSPYTGRVFIASLLKDNEDILKASWSDAVVNLTTILGPDNVFVSIHESGSRDGTKEELHSLGVRLQKLGAGHYINTVDLSQDMNRIMPPYGPGHVQVDGQRLLRRIPWLAELRNMNLVPLQDLARKGVFFDKVLFLNDIVFTSDDALELLSTRGGDYAAACGFDFSRPWPAYSFYDQFATRDLNGAELMALYYPYFDDGLSQIALRGGGPVPVKSCWSGIAAFDAAPFQNLNRPLRFRAIQDSLAQQHVEASECCLIHYDNTLSESKGVWMNPNVRVAYKPHKYEAIHLSGWPSLSEITMGKLSSVLTWVHSVKARRRPTDNLYREWTDNSGQTEIGSDCLVNKMMVVSDKGKWSEV